MRNITVIENTDNFRFTVKVWAIATLATLAAPSFALAAHLPSNAVPRISNPNHSDLLLAQSHREALGSLLAKTNEKGGEGGAAPPRRAVLGRLLVELETNIKWGAVDSKWQGRRDSWIADVRSTNDPVRLGELLTELESNITWSAVEKSWQQRRDSWLRDCGSVKSSAQVGQLLLELESNIKWEAVEGKWSQRRDGWVRDVQRVR